MKNPNDNEVMRLIFGGVPTDEQVDALKKEVEEEVQREKSQQSLVD
jgi:hypothetical protein